MTANLCKTDTPCLCDTEDTLAPISHDMESESDIQFNLALSYLFGIGIAKDVQKAYEIFSTLN